MLTEEVCLQKYDACKSSNGGAPPEYRNFLRHAGIDKRKLANLFGANAYSRLQELAGDSPNKLQMERTPLSTIMAQYGDLVQELGAVPPYAEWGRRNLKPTDSGLRAKPHRIKWSEMPSRFIKWVNDSKETGFEQAIEIIRDSMPALGAMQASAKDETQFSRLIKIVREWMPARRRNSEAEYKIELRKHLESVGLRLNEEFGESKFDLLVNGDMAIEIKKDPDLGEYDRLFGQLARHLQSKRRVIVLIHEATRKDKYDNFTSLVDRYLNRDANSVEVIAR